MIAQTLADYCKNNFDLSQVKERGDYGYPNLPLCVIDAVFSIGVRYKIVQNVIEGYRQHYAPENQTIPKLIEAYDLYGMEGMAKNVYGSTHRTSTKNGILKSEAVLRFATALANHKAHTNNDALNLIGNNDFENTIRCIPGQSSGISLSYFYMLVGAKNVIKPDRQITRFVYKVINQNLSVEQCQQLFIETCDILRKDYPDLTARALDHVIWEHMSDTKT